MLCSHMCGYMYLYIAQSTSMGLVSIAKYVKGSLAAATSKKTCRVHAPKAGENVELTFAETL